VFRLPPDHRVVRINGETHIVLEENGRLVPYAADHWKGARALLRKNLGQPVEVVHAGPLEGEPQTERIEKVTEEMLNTWPLRLTFDLSNMLAEMDMATVREPNPFKAMMIGVRKTYYFIEQVYVMMQRMILTRTMGFEQVSGPVGIVKTGSEIAQQDQVKLLYFLALISANLAVINFLPLPIVDGGLFVFLIIEKIKGSPIPLKIQVATQLIGLALIIGVFLYVTFNDITRLVG
jgi:regulator of sigma E protease